jgi:hypothetical protein
MKAYEFYSLDGMDGFHFIGVLPERRRDPQRISEESVINWVRQFLGDEADVQDIFFGTIKLKKVQK